MKWWGLARFLLRALAALAVLAAFAVLDWHPVIKDLGLLRREKNDLERKIRIYDAMTAVFQFPDAKERSILAQSESLLFHSLPQVANDAAWLALARSDLLGREKGLAGAITLFSDRETAGCSRPGSGDWLKLQAAKIGEFLDPADPRRNYPWRGLFPSMPPLGGLLACRPLAIALEAPQPELLRFIHHVSWGETRLEIVRLHLEPGLPLSRAWLVCRGNYRVKESSAWRVKAGEDGDQEELLIDPDSPLLLQRIGPLLAPGIKKRELPPVGSPW